MIVRLKIALEQVEYSALVKAAENELRNPIDQAHHILRKELTNIGLLEPDKSQNPQERSEIKEMNNG